MRGARVRWYLVRCTCWAIVEQSQRLCPPLKTTLWIPHRHILSLCRPQSRFLSSYSKGGFFTQNVSASLGNQGTGWLCMCPCTNGWSLNCKALILASYKPLDHSSLCCLLWLQQREYVCTFPYWLTPVVYYTEVTTVEQIWGRILPLFQHYRNTMILSHSIRWFLFCSDLQIMQKTKQNHKNNSWLLSWITDLSWLTMVAWWHSG